MTTTTLDLRPHDDREMLLLIACARASMSAATEVHVRALVEGGPDWPRLLALAERHGLRALLYAHLSRTGATAIAPGGAAAGAIASLRDYFHKTSALNVLLTGELLRLIAVLRDRGIEAVPFKGPALAVTLYGHVALRQFCDLDILVRARDVWRASDLLESEGFQPDVNVPAARRQGFIRRDYVQMFRRDGNRTLVELHWGIARHSFAVPFDADAIWPRLELMMLQGAAVLRPCAEDLLLMLCVHGSRHGWDKLEGICALAELVRRETALDWDAVWRRADEMHCRRMLVFGLLLAHAVCGVALPSSIALRGSRTLLAMARRVVQRFTADEVASRARTRVQQGAFHLRLKDSYTDQARYCARVAWHARGG